LRSFLSVLIFPNALLYHWLFWTIPKFSFLTYWT
jgi:hypothetical protein